MVIIAHSQQDLERALPVIGVGDWLTVLYSLQFKNDNGKRIQEKFQQVCPSKSFRIGEPLVDFPGAYETFKFD